LIQTPSIGRIVHYRLRAQDDAVGPAIAPAIITRIWSERCVNLTVFLADGPPVTRSSVELEDATGSIGRWFWPPLATTR
jgi:hypothetical protein